jgi:hypothetical protein
MGGWIIGNPTSGPKVYNPKHRGMPDNLFTQTHVANNYSELVWSWGPDVANLWKVWFDRQDTFESLMDNVEIQVRRLSYSHCRRRQLQPEQFGLGPTGRSAVAPGTGGDHQHGHDDHWSRRVPGWQAGDDRGAVVSGHSTRPAAAL